MSVFGVAAVALAACGTKTEVVELQPAQLDISTDLLEYGLVPKGESVDKEIVLSNGGDVPLGLDSVRLFSTVDNTRGHEESFRLLWNCGDVEVPNLNDTDESARSRPRVDTGVETDSDSDSDGTGSFDGQCVIPPGGRLVIRVRFQPKRAGQNWDSIVIETYGDDLADPDIQALAVDERVYRDLDTTWRQIYLNGEGGETTPRALVTPKTVDLGFVFAGQRQNGYVSIRNDGDGELRVGDVIKDTSNCSDGFDFVAPPKNTYISAGEAKVLEVVYAPTVDRQAQCRFRIETDDPATPSSEIVTEVLVVVNSGTNPANVPPRVIIHSPPPGYQHQGLNPLPLELTVFDPNEPSDGLYCKVRSGLQGLPDGRPALADCRPAEGNPAGHMIVPVPVDFYVKPGLDVFLVRVTDSSGVSREASVPVLLNAAYPETDDDGDGFGVTGPWKDCDDTNANIYPLAAEAYDGRDNDCDRLIDEGTDGFDDDGDGMSEAQGDCNDANANTYKGAPELRDQADNDCDGITDENTTAYDDDGDGYTELERDCNDRDPTINPGADELCSDGIDNDCDQILDDNDLGGCISTDSKPMIVGRLSLSRTAIELGATVSMFAQVFEEDGDEVLYEWEVKDGAGIFDDPTASTVNWTAPPELSNRDLIGEIFTIYAVAADQDGNQAWAFEPVWMYPEGQLDIVLAKNVEVQRGGCTSVPLAPAGLLAGLGLLLVGLRRRRD
jgi:hypothetical protein